MTLVCEDLATKAELQELKDQINNLLGKVEGGSALDVLNLGNLEGTKLGQGIDLAFEAIQDFGIGTESEGFVSAVDVATLGLVADGSLKYVASKGSDVLKVLPNATQAASKTSLKVVQNATVAKVGAKAAVVGSASLAVLASLVQIVTSLGLNIATVNVLGNRIDQNEKAILQYNQDYSNLINLNSKQNENTTKVGQELLKAKKIISDQQVNINDLKDNLTQANDGIETLNSNIEEANSRIENLVAEHNDLVSELNNIQEETTEEINNLKAQTADIDSKLTTAQNNFTTLLEITQDLGKQLADLEGRTTELEVTIANLKLQNSVQVAEMNLLKKEVAQNKTLTDSKLKTLEAKLILLQHNSKTNAATGGGGLPNYATENIANTQTKTLELMNQLSDSPLPSEQLQINTSSIAGANPFNGIFEQLLPTINPNPGEVSDVQLNDLETAIIAGLTAKMNDFGLNNVDSRLTSIQNNTTPNAIKSSVRDGVCESTNPGGCMNNNVYQPLRNQITDANNNINNVGGILDGINTFLNNTILSKLDGIQSTVTNNFNLLSHAEHGLAATKNFLVKAWETTRMGKILEFLSVAISLHNAAMLSRNLGASIGDTISAIANNAISFIKNEESSPIDINATLGNTIEGFLKGIIGAENYNNAGEAFTKYNRILNAASNIIWTIQGIQMGLAYGLETVGNYTGRIGNALKKSGAVLENSYNWMNEKMNFRSGRLATLTNVINQTQEVENVVSEVHQVTSEFREIQEKTGYLTTQVGNLQEELDLKETESLTQADLSKTNSQGAQPEQTDYTPDPLGE